ncbi:hypothetical protein SBOR_3754 [Sclerotinia borealis F-4128]|uniref:Uncharacterized protein n=1 Tax=Sclerotinia borealis (strain F-4128) TaxID=1432307 RepID=W9CMZ3_SCLBF|nr:hypothetical protein SBOR_3754 [Sclerotinia borealis F-4128]
MFDIDPKARKEVTTALINSGSAAVGRVVAAAHSSVKKRGDLKLAREKREAKVAGKTEMKAAKEKKNTTVRAQYPQFLRS